MLKWAFFYVSVLLSIGITSALAGEFRVSGMAEGVSGEKVRIIIPADPFSGTSQTLCSTITDSLGRFSLHAEIKTTQFGWIALGLGRSEIYLYPGIELEIKLITPEPLKPGRNPFLEPPQLRIDLIREGPNSLNHDISLFNATFDDFVATSGLKLADRRNKSLVDSLDRLVRGMPIDTLNPYLRNYIFYKMADIHVFLREMRYPAAYKKYLEKQQSDFGNIAYQDFFNNFYDDYLFSGSKINFFNDLDLCINKNIDLAGLLDSLGKDSLLRNERIRELVLLKHIPSLYYDRNYHRNNIIYLLTALTDQTKFAENRRISENLKSKLLRFNANAPIPEFHFLSQTGEDITKSAMENGVTCLIFFKNECDICDAEHELIPALRKKYGEKIRFLSVCCEPGPFGLLTYLRDHPAFNWEFADFNKDYDFLEVMGIQSFPQILLCGEGAKILKYPAGKPSERLEPELDRLLAK
jgi:thiol-disulfide isomerase/thioredoxin